jgi:hypothetical protein
MMIMIKQGIKKRETNPLNKALDDQKEVLS